MTGGKRLYVMRHARAVPYADTDRERPLTERGRRDAAQSGAHLAADLNARGVGVDHVLVSSAVRTRQTWDEVRAALGAEIEADVDDAMYGAEPDEILAALRLVPGSASTVLFIGHNPSAWYLAGGLDDGHGDAELIRDVVSGFAPATVAGFALPGEWSDLTNASARLVLLYAGG